MENEVTHCITVWMLSAVDSNSTMYSVENKVLHCVVCMIAYLSVENEVILCSVNAIYRR